MLHLPFLKKRFLQNFSWGFFLVVLLWIGIGLANLYSATFKGADTGLPLLFRSQLLWFGIGLGILLLVSSLSDALVRSSSYPFYLIAVGLLGLVFVFGRSIGDQRNWLVVGGFSFQPSEIGKIALILTLARYYSSLPIEKQYGIKDLLKPLLITLLPLSLVVLERDMGGAAFFILIFLTMTLFLKVRIRFLILAGLIGIAGSVAGYQYLLKDYQKARILTFIHPESDARGRGYHVVQSKIAVGSGGLAGKGFLKGNINKLKFLPERHTDFIFPVFAEEWGFLGALVLLFIMGLFLILGIDTAFQAQDPFGGLVAIGVTGLFFWHMVINLGGVLGLLPLTGVPLPLMSYGGSSILTMMLGIGLLFNVRMKKHMFD